MAQAAGNTSEEASQSADKPPAPDLDLALRFETAAGEPLPASLKPLLREGGDLTGAGAEERWHRLLSLWLAALAGDLPPLCRAPAYSLGLLLTDDASIAELNGQWRQRPEATDVLAFAALEALEADGIPTPAGLPAANDGEAEQEPLELGDIVISLETAARQASAAGSDLPRELLFLASHGLLHLLGWDHPDDASLEAMLQRQADLIAALPEAAPA